MRKKLFTYWLVWICCIIILPLPTARQVFASTSPFTQGTGYENGRYDRDAVQPTAFNWSRQSRFSGSADHEVRWTFAAEDAIYSTPVIGADGTLYVGSYDGILYAIHSGNGSLKWSYETEWAIASSPAIGEDGTIYVGSGDGKLYALDPHAEDDARVKWSYTTGDSIYASPSIGADGTIYIGSYDGKLYALDPDAADESSRLIWSYELGGPIDAAPAISADGTVYVGSGDGIFYALDPHATHEDDRVLWSFEPDTAEDCWWDWDGPCAFYSSPVIGSDGTIYVGSDDGYVYALDPYAEDDDERELWSYETWGSVSSSPAIGADGILYVGSSDGVLYAFDPDATDHNDREIWSFDTNIDGWQSIISSPVIDADGTIYIGTSSWYGDGIFYALDSKTEDDSGRLKWSLEMETEIQSSPVISSDGTIYIGSFDHQLYALGTKPSVPSDVAAIADDSSVKLSWEAAPGAAGYMVYSYEGTAAPAHPDQWVAVTDEMITTTEYSVMNLTAGQTYWFAITSIDDGGAESDYSSHVSAIPYANMIAVDSLTPIQVAKGVEAADLLFPAKVPVQSSDGVERDIPVIWDRLNTDYDPEQAGNYVFTGSLLLAEHLHNPDDLLVEQYVHVMPNTNAKLTEINMNDEPLLEFNPDIFTYHIAVPYSTEHLTVTAVTYDPAATYEVVGGASRSLVVGDNPVDIVVTAEDRNEQSTYSLHIERQEQPTRFITDVQELDDIEVAYGSILSDIPMPDTVAVTLDDHSLRNLSILWDEGSPEYKGNVPGTYQFTGTLQLPEKVENPSDLSAKLTVIVLAKPVNPPPPARTSPVIFLSNNANLSDLQVQADGKLLELQPSFAPDIAEYTIRTDAEKIELKATAAHYAAKVLVEDAVLTTGVIIPLTVGENKITITVQAENGTKKRYQLTVEREAAHTEPLDQVTDIGGHWAESIIQRAMERGIIGGYPDGTFQPERPITRVEFTVMLVNALQLQGDSPTLLFNDSDQIGDWAKQAAALASQAGIVLGYEDGSFRPNEVVTRAEMAVMIARAMNIAPNEYSFTSFEDDVYIPQWARSSVEALRRLEVITGRGGNLFVPNETATRAEAVVMILRLLEHI